MRYNELPSQDRLRELFDYDPDTGIVTRKIEAGGQVAGTVITSKNSGYIRVSVDQVRYKLHRVIWRMMTGEDPGDLLIDHEDRNKTNNKWNNLRLARRGSDDEGEYILNSSNVGIRTNNTTGASGVYWCKRDETYIVKVTIDGKKVRLGSSKDLEEAKEILKRGKIIKTYHLLDPQGNGYETTNLTAFCRDHDCDRRALHKYKKSKGYILANTTTTTIR